MTHQISLIELELCRVLLLQLVHTVQELHKDRADLVGVTTLGVVTSTLCKLVAKVQPLTLHKHLETLVDIGSTLSNKTFYWCTHRPKT